MTVYKLWHEIKNHIPKQDRYTLGTKIDVLFLETLELFYTASTLSTQQKLPILLQSSERLNIFKFFLYVGWDMQVIDDKKYAVLSEPIDEIGRMLGGWIKNIATKNPAMSGERKE